MAALRSLGLHIPAGLSYMIAEKILPEDPPEDSYVWQTYNEAHGQEELLVTKSCVAWSRGGITRKVLSFDAENQQVRQAVLTWFPSDRDSIPKEVKLGGTKDGDLKPSASGKRRKETSTPDLLQSSSAYHSLARAIVVFLEHQAHVYFLSGASHVLDLHFEVERAFPAPCGLLIQRKLAIDHPNVQLTPKIPAAPPNSFFSQLSFPPPQPKYAVRGSLKVPLPGELNWDALKRFATPATDTLPRHFSLTNPLSEMGLVVSSTPELPLNIRNSHHAGSKELDSLGKDEEILYVTAFDEVPHDDVHKDSPLTLVVTASKERRMYSIWQATYTTSQPASSLFSGHYSPSTSGIKTRRRSSFVTTTGATTPALRARDNQRESLGGPARAKTVPTLSASQTTQTSAEDMMASQLDPEFDARQPAKESRRVSSILSRADLSTNFDRSAFEDLATHHSNIRASFGPNPKRGQSLGGTAIDRTSFGPGASRRLRASTPGAFSRLSLDESSDIGTVMNYARSESATIDDLDESDDTLPIHTASLDFQQPFSGLKKEVLLSKVAEVPMNASLAPGHYSFGPQSNFSNTRVFVISSPKLASETGHYGRRFFLHIMNRAIRDHVQVEFTVQRHRISVPATNREDLSRSSELEACFVPFATCKHINRLEGDADVTRIFDGSVCRILCLQDTSGQPSLRLHAPWSPELPFDLSLNSPKIFKPFVTHSTSSLLSPGVLDPKPIVELIHPGPFGALILRDAGQRLHRIQIQLAPRNESIGKILELCSFAMPGWTGDWLLAVWWGRYQACQGTEHSEWNAVVEAIFTMALALDESSAKPVRSGTNYSPGKTASSGEPDVKHAPIALMLQLEALWPDNGDLSSPAWAWASKNLKLDLEVSKKSSSNEHISRIRNFIRSKAGQECVAPIRANPELTCLALSRMLTTLHLLREEWKLDITRTNAIHAFTGQLAPLLAQVGRWMDWSKWDWKPPHYYSLEMIAMPSFHFEDMPIRAIVSADHQLAFLGPPSIYEWFEKALVPGFQVKFPSLLDLFSSSSKDLGKASSYFFPRSTAVSKYLIAIQAAELAPEKQVEAFAEAGISDRMLETLPDAVLAVFKDAMVRCQANPPTTWTPPLLELVGREDLALLSRVIRPGPHETISTRPAPSSVIPRDIHSICQSSERHKNSHHQLPETDRNSVSRLIFSEDRRFIEALHMIEPLRVATAECIPDPSWSEAQVLDAQKEIVQWVMVRTFALAPGQGMAHFDSRRPLLTDRYIIHGYSTLCVMKPMMNTVSADRASFTEERYGWAWYHAGVAAGLGISRYAEGIDTSWIVFNKPAELNNRHAGLLLALGLNGHLKNIAKWLAFKYLTPKHTMTSIGLLLGLSASRLGSMDTLVTRLLSVHVTRMLPPGAAELNLSPLTQTAGLMGIGLLYYNTQHRRMSEMMLSELENVEVDDPAGAPSGLRDEGYRLAAGFALGYINLGEGNDLKGLHDMRIIERLLAVAVGPRPVDLVHILDQASAGATIAIALVFMKTGNKAVARKVDVPDTLPQFDYVRPDILLLRTLAKHMILWDDITAEYRWIIKNLPSEYAKEYHLRDIRVLRSQQMPFYNIISGLLWSISLKYAGSGDTKVRDFLLKYLDAFIRLCKISALRYDAKLTRNTVRNCQDLVALSCATVMAGTGDLDVMRRLRLLHGRVNADTPYGSHLAAHLALGTLFLGGGSFTFGTNNLAVASLICAFYPLLPMDVTDNKAHLQAFRHLWVLASENRCIVTRDVDTRRAIRVPLILKLRDGSAKSLTAPCLLPELHLIAQVETQDQEYWPIILDFENNSRHLQRFRIDQTLYVRRRGNGEAQAPSFEGTLMSLHDAQTVSVHTARRLWEFIFQLPVFKEAGFEGKDSGAILPVDERSALWSDGRGSVVDRRLALTRNAVKGMDRDALWNLRILFRWAEGVADKGGDGVAWLGKEIIEGLRGVVEDRGRRVREVA